MVKAIGGEINAQDLNDNFSELESQMVGKDFIPYLNVKDYGASMIATKEANKTAVQTAIDVVAAQGGGFVMIPPDVNYGYNRNDPSTHPDFSHITEEINLVVQDFSKGATYDDRGDGSRDGSQMRYFFHTGNQSNNLHDGNGMWLHSKYAGYIFLQHDGDSATRTERRLTLFFGNEGDTSWGIGQGINSVTDPASATDDELSDFKIAGNNVGDPANGGFSGLGNLFVINKKTRKMGWNTSSPRYDFDFVGKVDGVVNFESQKGNLDVFKRTKSGKYTRETLNDTDGGLVVANQNGTARYKVSEKGNARFYAGVSGSAFTTAERNALVSLEVGTMVFDTTLGKPVWWKGASWVDANGTTV